MAVTYCMGKCVVLYGKCEDCILKKIGKYDKEGQKMAEQMVVITHQPIGSRPRLVSDMEPGSGANLAAAIASAAKLESGDEDDAFKQSSSRKTSAFHRSKADYSKGHPDYSRYRKSVYKSKVRQSLMRDSTSADDEAIPMLSTWGEPIQPGVDDIAISRRFSNTEPPKIRSRSSSGDESLGSSALQQPVSGTSDDADGADFDSCQSLRFTMLYQPGNSRLQVTVKSFCILPPKMTAGCYVVASLLTNCKSGEEKLASSHKTTIKQKTKIPEWEETFVIDNVQRPDGEGETMIRLDVVAFDQFSREVVIGRIKMDVAALKDCVSQEFFKTVDEEKVEDDGQICPTSLLVGLFYHHTTHTLVLDMIKVKDVATVASHLTAMLSAQSSASVSSTSSNQLKHVSFFVKARLYESGNFIKERKTSDHKVQEEVINESLTFNLDKRNIRNVTAEFSLYIRTRKEERQIGWFSLGSSSSGQTEKEHWANMLRSHASPVVQWLTFKQPTSVLLSGQQATLSDG